MLFTSPQGFVIQLAAVETGNLTPEEYLAENQLPNTRCSTGVNPHGLATRTCLDTLAGSYTADFAIESPGGAKQLLTMSVAKLGDRRTFDAMAASVRLAP